MAEFISSYESPFKSSKGNIIISKNVNIFVSAKIFPFSDSKAFRGTKYVEKAKKKWGKPTLCNIKDLTTHNLNKTKFGSSHYEGFCEMNVLEY